MLRISFAAFVLFLATGCTIFTAISDVRYAPGYGYVVYVSEDTKFVGTDNYLYVFDTEEQARAFLAALRERGLSVLPNYRTVFDEKKSYDIYRESQPLPPKLSPGFVGDIIDRVNIPVPTAPAPQ